MDEKRYYVSIQSKTVSEIKDDISHPFEIIATSEQLSELTNLLQLESEVDESALVRIPIAAYSSHPEDSNQKFDSYLSKIYNKIYELGTLQSREHIEKMNIL